MVERWLGEVLYSIVDAMPTRTQLKQFGCRSSDGFDPMCLTSVSGVWTTVGRGATTLW